MAAVGSNRLSATLGYVIKGGNFNPSSPNLPVRVAVLCEANEANQSLSDLIDEWEAPSLKAVGARYGYGSPAYLAAREHFIIADGIPLVFYPQAKAAGATSKKISITVSGTATESVTHTLLIAGRDGLDGQFYDLVVENGDSAPIVHDKITNALSSVLGCPMLCTNDDYEAVLESKWKGLTANALTVNVDTQGKPAGLTYTINENVQSGAGTPSIGAALVLMAPKWNTHLINGYGTVTSVLSALEVFNGVADPDNPTGRYVGTTFKPLVSFSGSTDDDPSAITDARSLEMTHTLCPAPNSACLPIEAAAVWCARSAYRVQNAPELDILDKDSADLPVPSSLGTMADYDARDIIVKKGCSTVDKFGNKLVMKDLVTTYHPEGELIPTYRYVRDLYVAFNIEFGYRQLVLQYMSGALIANDSDIVDLAPGQRVIKPKIWKGIVIDYFNNLVRRGLIVDEAFSASSLSVSIDSNNQNRINTTFKTKLSGIARISATENIIGFNFNSTNA